MSAYAAKKFAHHLARRGSDCSVAWTETSGGTVKADTKTVVGGATAARSLVFLAQVHTPNYADWRVRHFGEVEEGQIFLDFAPGELAAVFAPAAGVRVDNIVFTVEGRRYTVKSAGQGGSPIADAVNAGVPISSTIRLIVKP